MLDLVLNLRTLNMLVRTDSSLSVKSALQSKLIVALADSLAMGAVRAIEATVGSKCK